MARTSHGGPAFTPGSALPALEIRPTTMQLFQFSAVTWNRHHVHYSKDAALAEGLPDVVVHRALLGNFLARMLTDWAGSASALRELSWKVQRSATPGAPLTCRGTVESVEETAGARRVRCAVEIVNAAGETVAAGAAVVEIA